MSAYSTTLDDVDPGFAEGMSCPLKDRRHFDAAEQLYVVKIFAGDWYVSKSGKEMISTILGSCVSACIRDPVAGVGGMNHFLLPGDENTSSNIDDAARYGVFAMESLLNALFKAGGRKERLEIKIFGGGNVTQNSARIGSKNAAFIRDFLRREGYRIETQDLEGKLPRRVHYYPVSGKVMMRALQRQEDMQVVQEENKFKRFISTQPIGGEVELF
jgi:chemotaxis protein CheD